MAIDPARAKQVMDLFAAQAKHDSKFRVNVADLASELIDVFGGSAGLAKEIKETYNSVESGMVKLGLLKATMQIITQTTNMFKAQIQGDEDRTEEDLDQEQQMALEILSAAQED